jgi:lipopolysaccharide transport system permease protein
MLRVELHDLLQVEPGAVVVSQAHEPPVVSVIEPARGWSFPDLRELWGHRELAYSLARRDIAVRYKQTAIGALWAVAQPLALAGVFSVFLGLLAKVPSSTGLPYPIFALTGMTMWLFFAFAVTNISESTLSNQELISKVYFPRLLLPIAAATPAAVDFCVALVVLLIVASAYGIVPSVHLLLLPAIFALAVATAFGVGLWLSAVIVRYRDVRLLVPFMITVLLFMTPVVYPLSLVPEQLQPLYAVNPMVGVLEGFRWCILPGVSFPGWLLLIPTGVSLLLGATGVAYFHKAEQSFADVI